MKKIDIFNDLIKHVDYDLLNFKIEQTNRELFSTNRKDNELRYSVNYLYTKLPEIKIPKKIELKDSLENEKIVSVVLDFYKNIDYELYNEAKDIVMGNSDYELLIYDYDSKDNLPKNKDFPKYVTTPAFIHCNRKIILENEDMDVKDGAKGRIYVPRNGKIDDIYVLAHEISHTFDFYKDYSNKNYTREFFGEVMASFFEDCMDDYLLKKKLVTESEVLNRRSQKYSQIRKDALSNVVKLDLSKVKRNNEKIEAENLLEYITNSKNSINVDEYFELYKRMISKNETISYSTRYTISQLLGVHIYEKYKKEPDKTMQEIRNYINCMKKDDFDGILNCLEIDLSNPNNIFNSQREYLDDLNCRIEKILNKDEHSR